MNGFAGFLQRVRIMQNYSFQINYDEQSYTVTGYQGDEAEAVIPEVFGGKPVTILFDGCVNLRHLDLPRDLTFLWGYTFVRCGLEEIVLPAGVRSIPPYAFKDCKNLKKVVCGAGLKEIHDWAFGGCDQLEEVVYGPDVLVHEKAFQNNEDILRI